MNCKKKKKGITALLTSDHWLYIWKKEGAGKWHDIFAGSFIHTPSWQIEDRGDLGAQTETGRRIWGKVRGDWRSPGIDSNKAAESRGMEKRSVCQLLYGNLYMEIGDFNIPSATPFRSIRKGIWYIHNVMSTKFSWARPEQSVSPPLTHLAEVVNG